MIYLSIVLLCAASAVLGRLVLTRDEAWRTITVRIPAFAALVFVAAIYIAFLLFFAVLCFIGGSFFGLYTWWLPVVGCGLEIIQAYLEPTITGKWA